MVNGQRVSLETAEPPFRKGEHVVQYEKKGRNAHG
jgi:hypothetical protein